MAGDAGSLELKLRADISRLERDLAKAEKRANTAGKRMAMSFKKVTTALKALKAQLMGVVGIMGMLVAGGLAQMSKAAIRTANDIGDISQKLGVSSSALQEFQYSANQSGVKLEALNMGLQRFGRRAAEAAQGTGEAKDAIRQLGIELKDNEGNLRSTEALFTDAIASLGEIENPLERVRLGFKLFDSEGVSLVNMAGSMGALREEAQALGLVIDEDVIAHADELQDSFDALWAVTKGQLTPVLVDLGGSALTSVLESMSELAYWSNKVYRHFADIENLGLTNLKKKVEEIEEARLKVVAQITKMADKPSSQREGTTYFGQLHKELAHLTKKLLSTQARIKEIEDRKADETVDAPPPATNFKTDAEMKAEARAEETALKARKKFALDAHRAWLEQSGQRKRAIREELELDIARLEEGKKANEDYTIAIAKMRETASLKIKEIQDEEAEALRDALEDEKDAYAGLFEFMERGFTDAMATMLMEGELTFKSLAQSFLREFLQMGIGKLVAKGMGIVGGYFAAGAIPNAVPDLNLDFTPQIDAVPTIPSLGGMANGGPINGPVLVGERGPELFMPGKSGFVATNSNLRKMGGVSGSDGKVTVTVINNSGQESTTTEQDGADGRKIEVMIGKAVAENIHRGGNIDQSIRNSYGVNRVGRHGV